jgi:hypothetical protein
MDKQRKKEMRKKYPYISNELAQIFTELLRVAVNRISPKKFEPLTFGEAKALTTGIRLGAELSSKGMAIILKHLEFSEQLARYGYKLIEANDKSLSVLLDSILLTPPEAKKGEK